MKVKITSFIAAILVSGKMAQCIEHSRSIHVDGLVQDCSISSVLVMEILQPCTKPSICRALGGPEVRAAGPWKSNGLLWNFAWELNAPPPPPPPQIGELVMFFNGGTLQILLGALGNSNGGGPRPSTKNVYPEPWICISKHGQIWYRHCLASWFPVQSQAFSETNVDFLSNASPGSNFWKFESKQKYFLLRKYV